MSAEIQSSLGVEVTLTPGQSGIFDVKKDGMTIFSRYETGRFPLEGEIAELLLKG